ncbi:MAG TPA: hypothetical protein DIU15_08095 [Deltaproteobacteria bacterium]|nr:hypothetical protein [Deltaproteobacteria bacterium]HCP45985.1 hypothetical protein [Deltaproteobacteria bacterium]
MGQLFPMRLRLCRPKATLWALTIVLCAAWPTGEAQATDGFDRLTWGMSRAEVIQAYEGQVRNDDEPRGAPSGTDGSRLIIDAGSRLFGEYVEFSCFFDDSGLVTIRLQYAEPKEQNAKALIDWYRPHWGEPIESIDRNAERNRRKRVWAWPWEGVALRSVDEGGTLLYQRVDFSRLLSQKWTKLDHLLCSMLPGTSSCEPKDALCPQQDTSMPQGKRTKRIRIDTMRAEIACSYRDYRLLGTSLILDRPSEETTAWFHRILGTHLGESTQEHSDAGTQARIDTLWSAHGVMLRESRKATTRTAAGWTGPLVQLRVRHSAVPPAAP